MSDKISEARERLFAHLDGKTTEELDKEPLFSGESGRYLLSLVQGLTGAGNDIQFRRIVEDVLWLAVLRCQELEARVEKYRERIEALEAAPKLP